MKSGKIKKSKSTSRNILEYQKKCPETETAYLEILRRMDGEKKLKTAFELYEIALNLCRESILEKNSTITGEELKREVFKRFGYGTGRFINKSNR